jgi:hypothetical protein
VSRLKAQFSSQQPSRTFSDRGIVSFPHAFFREIADAKQAISSIGMTVLTRTILCALAVVALLRESTTPASADAYDGDSHFSLTPYIWLPSFHANLRFSVPPGGNTELNASAANIVDLLKFAAMGTADARRGNWSIFTDFIFVNLADDHTRTMTVTGPRGEVEIPVTLGTKMNVKSDVWTLAGSYSILHKEDASVDLFLGTRYLGTRAVLDWSLASPSLLLPQSGRSERGAYLWDAIVGVKGRYSPFAGTRWYVPYYLDVGGGDNDFTWQAAVGLGYTVDWGDISFVYRNLAYRPSDKGLIEKLNLRGPALAVTLHF